MENRFAKKYHGQRLMVLAVGLVVRFIVIGFKPYPINQLPNQLLLPKTSNLISFSVSCIFSGNLYIYIVYLFYYLY